MTRREFNAAYAPTPIVVRTPEWFGVFAWRGGDGRYLLGAAIGSRLFKREASAKKYADELNAQPAIAGEEYVVRSSDYVDPWGCEISPTMRVRLTVPCPCADSNGSDPMCPHHHREVRR